MVVQVNEQILSNYCIFYFTIYKNILFSTMKSTAYYLNTLKTICKIKIEYFLK